MNLGNIEMTTVQQAAYERIRVAILTGRLKPGQRISEQELAEQLRVSRTPIREALRQLELEMLVVHVPRKGVEIAKPSREVVEQVYQMRIVLEGLAAKLTSQRIDDEGLAALERSLNGSRRGYESGDDDALVLNNADFHTLIARHSGNAQLFSMAQMLQAQVCVLRQIFLTIPHRPEEMVYEHGLIYDAIANRNAEMAECLAMEHMKKAADAALHRYPWPELISAKEAR